MTDRVAALVAEEARLVLDAFDPADACRLGLQMAGRGLAEGAPIIIDIRRADLVLFRAALPGTTPENEAWLDRKARTTLRFDASSALVEARLVAQGVDPWTAPWFDHQAFAATGGSFPVRVRGVGVVAAVTVSGLTSDEDHAYAVSALTAFVGRAGGSR